MNRRLTDETGEVRELGAAFFRAARRGRPPLPEEARKQRVNIMLDRDVVARLREGGEKGWQTRLNAKLREALGL